MCVMCVVPTLLQTLLPDHCKCQVHQVHLHHVSRMGIYIHKTDCHTVVAAFPSGKLQTGYQTQSAQRRHSESGGCGTYHVAVAVEQDVCTAQIVMQALHGIQQTLSEHSVLVCMQAMHVHALQFLQHQALLATLHLALPIKPVRIAAFHSVFELLETPQQHREATN